MESALRPFPDVAREAQVTPDRVRYWLDLLEVEPIRQGRNRFVTLDQARQVVAMARMVTEGQSPQAAAALLKAAPAPEVVPVQPMPAQPSASDQAPRLEAIEKALVTLAERVGQLVEENQALRLRLEPPATLPADPPRPIRPWSPEPARDPAASMPWWKVAWLSLVAPEQLRRCNS